MFTSVGRAVAVVACIAVSLGALQGCGGKRPEGGIQPPAVGAKAPELSLKKLDGAPVVLAELTKGGPVVLVELRGWVGYQCPICSEQFADLMAHAEQFKAAGAQVVVVYPGPAEHVDQKAKDFLDSAALPENMHFVLDPDLVFTKAWGLHWDALMETAYPASFVIDGTGTVTYAKVSDGHGGRASAQDVLDALAGKG